MSRAARQINFFPLLQKSLKSCMLKSQRMRDIKPQRLKKMKVINKIKLLFFGIGLFFLFCQPAAAADWLDDFEYRIEITTAGAKVATSTIDNYVIMFPFSLITDQTFWNTIQSDGKDIRATDKNNNQLPVDISNISVALSSGNIFFKTSSLTNANDSFYLYFGSSTAAAPAAGDTYGRNAVWSDYAGVWHLQTITNGSASVLESSGNATNGTPTSVDTVSGQISNAGLFNADGDKIDFSSFSSSRIENILNSSHGGSWQFWTYPTEDMDNNGGYRRPIISKGVNNNQDFALFFPADSMGQGEHIDLEVRFGNNNFQRLSSVNTTWNANRKYFIGLSVSATTTKTYKWNIWENENKLAGETIQTYSNKIISPASRENLLLGAHSTNFFARGWIDEIRICKKYLSDDFLETDYNNQYSPSTFFSVSDAESFTPPQPPITGATTTTNILEVKSWEENGTRYYDAPFLIYLMVFFNAMILLWIIKK